MFDVFVKFYKMFQIKFHTLIHILRVDNFGEHINLDMQQFFSTHGLIHQTTCLDTPQQNDIAKLKNQTLLDITWAIMFESHAPTSISPKAIAIAIATYL